MCLDLDSNARDIGFDSADNAIVTLLKRGLSQVEIAKKLKCSQSIISNRIKNNRLRLPKTSVYSKSFLDYLEKGGSKQ